MRSWHKWAGALFGVIFLAVTNLFSTFTSDLILRVMSVWSGLIVSLSLCLVCLAGALLLRGSRHVRTAFWALFFIFLIVAVGLLNNFIYDLVLSSLGKVLFVVVMFTIIYGFIYYGIIKVNKKVMMNGVA